MDNHLVYMEEMKEKGKSTDYHLSFKNGDHKGCPVKSFWTQIQFPWYK